MAATEHLDRVSDISASEQGGQVVEVRRLALVSGLTDDSFEAVYTALDTLSLKAQSALLGHANLILMQRNPRVIDNGAAEVELVYRHFSENEFQDLAAPPGPNSKLVFRTEAGLAEKMTQVDSAGAALTLTYIYPAADSCLPPRLKPTDSDAVRTTTQGGEAPVRIPTKTKRLSGTLSSPDPDGVVDGIRGKVNSGAWQGGAARTWLCTEAGYTPWDLEDGRSTYRYDFTFEYNADGWDPKTVFIHEITGKIPGDWDDQANCFKTVTWYTGIDFGTYFIGSKVFGWADDF